MTGPVNVPLWFMAPHTPIHPFAKSGRLGRSFGCPALPQALTKPIINTIKGGSVLFIYANNKEYMAKSSILPNQTSQELFTEACESEQTVSAHL